MRYLGRKYILRFAAVLALAAAAIWFPRPARAVVQIQVETWYYACGSDTLYPNGYESYGCDAEYYSEGDVTPNAGDFKQVRVTNCSTGTTRTRWYYWCAGGWTALDGPPANGWCHC